MRNILLIILLGLFLVTTILYAYNSYNDTTAAITFYQFLTEAREKKIKTINIKGTKIEGEYRGGPFKYYRITDAVPPKYLAESDLKELQSFVVDPKDFSYSTGDNALYQIFLTLLPILLLIGVI